MRPRNKDTENLEARHRRRRECSSPDISSDPVTSSCISVKSSESEYCSANEDIRESLVGSERGGGGAGKHSDINKHEHTSKVPLPRDKQKVFRTRLRITDSNAVLAFTTESCLCPSCQLPS